MTTPKKPVVHFVDFDQPDELREFEEWSRKLDSRNFVLDFDNESARCARDLDDVRMTVALKQRAELVQKNNSNNTTNAGRRQSHSGPSYFPSGAGGVGTRWINIWKPEEQRGLVHRVGKHYGFSARLLASMCCRQPKVQEVSERTRHEHRTMGEVLDELIQPWRSHGRKKGGSADGTSTSGSGNGSGSSQQQQQQQQRRGRPPGPKQAAAVTRVLSKATSSSMGSGWSDGAGDGAPPPSLAAFELDHYRLVSDVWHFSSVDWGKRYLCIGFNSLYRVDREIDVDSYRPAGKRVWTWLVLCDDGTVIAIHENPFPHHQEPLSPHQARTVLAIRRNLRNILMQLSRGFDDRKLHNALETIKLRSNLPVRKITNASTPGSNPSNRDVGGDDDVDGDDVDDDGNDDDDDDDDEDNPSAPTVCEDDAPSLLFYYLFDDWFTSYSLVARREHQYGVELDGLRDRMFHRAELEHVSRLHHYGRQLAVLKRIYNSYSIIIQRVLDGPQAHLSPQTAATAITTHPVAMQDSDMTDRATSSSALMHGSRDALRDGGMGASQSVQEIAGGNPGAYGVAISVAAATRFRRLRDRINMYAVGEIQDCIEEKNSLMELNFNLITLKESSYIEGLTRITILLAKATILFLPVSFITAYFTVDFTSSTGDPIQYSVHTYWAVFAVTFFLTASGLTLFGRLSGTQEGKPIYQSFTRVFVNAWRGLWKKQPPLGDPNEAGQIQLRALST